MFPGGSPRSCAKRRERSGFSLVEVAIAIGVISLLTGAVVWAWTGHLDAARLERTQGELTHLLRGGVDVVTRAGKGGTDGQALATRFQADATGKVTTAEFSLQLEGLGERVCFDLAGTGWGGARAPIPRLQQALGPNVRDGRNVYGRPYALCVNRHVVSVASCVPARLGRSEWTRGGFSANCPTVPGFRLACAGDELCLSAGTSISSGPSANRASTYKYLYHGESP